MKKSTQLLSEETSAFSQKHQLLDVYPLRSQTGSERNSLLGWRTPWL